MLMQAEAGEVEEVCQAVMYAEWVSEHQIWLSGSFKVLLIYVWTLYETCDYMETSLLAWTPPAYVDVLDAGLSLIVSIYFSVKLLFLLGWRFNFFQWYGTTGITSTSDVSNYIYMYNSQYLLQIQRQKNTNAPSH